MAFLCVAITMAMYVVNTVDCDITQPDIYGTEMETIEIICYSNDRYPPHWGVTNSKHPDFDRIYSTFGLVESYAKDGRYSVWTKGKLHGLKISNVTLAESGTYRCDEDLGGGAKSYARVTISPRILSMTPTTNTPSISDATVHPIRTVFIVISVVLSVAFVTAIAIVAVQHGIVPWYRRYCDE